MATCYEVEVTLTSAKDLKNVNWRHGPIRPYVVLWLDPSSKCSSGVDEAGDVCPYWDETIAVPIQPDQRLEDAVLSLDVVHAGREEGTKPLIGSARLKLKEVLDDAGLGERLARSLQLKRPSGRPQGKLEVKVCVREPRYRSRDAYYAQPYGVPPPPAQSAYTAPPAPHGYPYSQAPLPPVAAYGSYGYGQYGAGASAPMPPPVEEEKKKSKFGGMGTGLAVGAVAGALGGLALVEGAEYMENKFEDDVAAKVEDDLADEGTFYDDDDF